MPGHPRSPRQSTPSSQAFAGACVLALALFGFWKYAHVVDLVYPINQWLFWKLAMLWGWALLFNVACVSFGQLVLVRVLRLRTLPALESALFSMALGVLGFVLAMYVAGALALFSTAFAIALPLLLLAAGQRYGRRLFRELVAQARASRPLTPLTATMSAAGVLCVGVIYLGALTPDALNYDSTWCHLTVAQDYAREGRIVPFPADYTKNVPQLASLIHTWGWLLPKFDPPLRWMMVLLDEFLLFVWTLVGVSAGVRRLIGDQSVRASWAAFFLFPIIFVYDNNLGGAADHVCAFFSVPIMLATLRVCAGFSLGDCALLGAMCAASLLTKFQAAYLIAPVGLVVGVAWLRQLPRARGDRSRLRTLLLAPLVAGVVGAVCASPHFIRQAVFHHNPFYPFLQNVIKSSTPTLPDAAFLFSQTITDANWVPRGTLPEKLRHGLRLFFTFSFEPHYTFNRNVPAFGSLFTLLLPALFFVQARTRIAIAAFISSVAVLIWATVYNVDRNLQVFMPVMVCVTAALIIRAWQLGFLARAGLVPLIALQLVWGADTLFYSGHERIHSAIDLLRSGYDGRVGTRFSGYRAGFLQIRDALPKNARVLLHTTHISLGIDRPILLDWVGYQALISYDHVHSPRELYDYYRKLGITHLIEEGSHRNAGTRQEEVLWCVFTTHYAKSLGHVGGYRLWQMPEQPPPAEPNYKVAAVGIDGYSSGLYPIERMHANEYLSGLFRRYERPVAALPSDPALYAAEVDAVFIGAGMYERGDVTALRHAFPSSVQLPNQILLRFKKRPPR